MKLPQWKHVVLDIETDGLIENVSQLHCLVIRDIESKAVLSCADQDGYAKIEDGLRVLDGAERIYGHNLIKYDRPVLYKLRGYLIPWEKVRDTLVIAGCRWTNLKETDARLVQQGKLPSHLLGKNRLEAWGYRLGVRKGTFHVSDEEKRWERWTPQMQEYCEQDTLVTALLVEHIRKAGGLPQLTIEIEQELAEYLRLQEQNGWPFDMVKAAALQAKLAARREELAEELRKTFGRWYKPVTKHGKVVVFTAKVNNRILGLTKGAEYTKVKLVEFNPGSRAHIAERLQKLYGWKPTVFTESGEPKVDEYTLMSLPQNIPGVKLIVEYLLVTKRLGQLAEGNQAWLKQATDKGKWGGRITGMPHIHGVVLQSGTITHRAAHINPNLAQVPKVGRPYGAECRALFCVPPGWVQIGADVSSLELRELSHFMAKYDGGAYGRTVTEGKNEDGTDIHSVNRNALGLEGKSGRDAAKTFIYAFLYGSGDLNLGQLLGVTDAELAAFKEDAKAWRRAVETLEKRRLPTDDYTVSCLMKGAKLRATFLKNLPALSRLIDMVKAKAKQNGYLLLHDGRRVPVRHQHAALNSLLQACGAVVCKLWIVRFNRRLTAEFGPQGWDGKWAALGWIHDEVQLAVRPEIADRVKQILVEEIRATGHQFNLRVPLDGEAKDGFNWADTH